MKKTVSLVLAIVLALAMLTACGAKAEGNPPAETAAPAAAEVSTESESFDEIEKAAASLIGKTPDDAVRAFGEADSETYSPSCLGDGEDGVIVFGNVTVYTYREGGNEEIRTVIIDENGTEVEFPD